MVRDEETDRKRMSRHRDGGSERCPAVLSDWAPSTCNHKSWSAILVTLHCS